MAVLLQGFLGDDNDEDDDGDDDSNVDDDYDHCKL